ncbi:MAG: transcriptional regulator NrdR, partial [Tepidisphaeraceae bacterium]
MRCPFCDSDKESLKVIDSRSCDGGKSIRRRRQCLECSRRFTTYERAESPMRLTVVKRDGSRQPWDREKVRTGLERACFKRPVPQAEITRIVEEVEEETFRSHDREVPSEPIGRLVADKLRRVDQVAYVRFASVYKQFKTLEELVNEAKAVIDARRYDDPDQGKLFVEGEKPRGNGSHAHEQPPAKPGRAELTRPRRAVRSAPPSDDPGQPLA